MVPGSWTQDFKFLYGFKDTFKFALYYILSL